jgi:hypothetical protein
MLKFKKLVSLVVVATMLVSSFSLFSVSVSAEENTDSDFTYVVFDDDADNPIVIADGESIEIPFQIDSSSDSSDSRLRASTVVTGDAGTITLTANGSTVSWNVKMTIPSVLFVGTLSTTDLTKGLPEGSYSISGFSGSKLMGLIIGHKYSVSITGTALTLLGIATSQPNELVWVNN